VNFVQSIIELLKSFWPLVIVQAWERGEYYVCGKHWRSVGAGLKLIVPWFCEIYVVPIRSTPISTPRMDLTLRSGNNISFSSTAVVRVTDAKKAVNDIDDYKESTQEIIAATLADRHVRVKEERLDPENRAGLLRDLRGWVNEETGVFGVEAESVRFTTFVQGARTYRLLADQGAAPW
jgi:regulator of protease activity HflC (stomatin/prohibitin superfamily)